MKFLLKSVLFFTLSFIPCFSLGADHVIVANGEGVSYIQDNLGNLIPLSVTYTTDGNGNLQTLNGLNVGSDNLIVPTLSGKAYLSDNSSRLFPASVVYTTDGAGNVIPVTGGSGGGVSSVTGTAPVVSSGGSTPAISMAKATSSVDGYLFHTDWSTFNSKQSALTFSSPLVNTTGTISIPSASGSTNGYLTNTDWSTFNSKFTLPSFTAGSIPFSDGTTLTQDNTNLFYDNTNKSMLVGPGPHPASSATLAITSQPSDTKTTLSVFSTSSNNAVQFQNQNAFTLAALTASNTNSPSINFERARGTLAAKTQVLAGDILGSFIFNGYTGSADGSFAAGFGAIATENQAAGHAGALMIFETTSNASTTLTPRWVIDQDGTFYPYTDNVYTAGKSSNRISAVYSTNIINSSHIKISQSTPPTATVNGDAGTSATCTVSKATDMAGVINLTSGTGVLTGGAQCVVNFTTAFGVSPICTLTPINSATALSTVSPYLTASTAGLTLNFASAAALSTAYNYNYSCIEAQ